MSFNYDDLERKSYFTDLNLSGKYAPSTISRNMIPCNNINEFHYQTSFFLNLYTSLLIELKKDEQTNDYNINKFSNTINNLNIIFSSNDYSASPLSSSQTNNLSTFSNNTFTFYYKTFENLGNVDNLYTTTYSAGYSNYFKYKPEFSSTTLTTGYINSLINNIFNKEINKTNIDKISNNIISDKLKQILRQILNQKPENIIGFLLYQKINYNIILYNIDIQETLRNNYINNTDLTNDVPDSTKLISTPNYFKNINKVSTEVAPFTNVKVLINNHITNLQTISKNNFDTNDYLAEKGQYKNKINTFNVLREEYAKTQDKLNISIKLYNQQLENYNKIKNYATYVIIALIIIICLTISFSIFPIFSSKTKNAIYIITFIILLIITYLYYTNFKYVILYENFDCSSPPITIPTGNISRTNHADYFNLLLPYINRYTNAIDDLINDLRMNIYTLGSKSFSQDSNIIVYNVYLEKKRQLEINNIKLTNLFNTIEIIKKQITYLFNFVFIISCLCLILLLGLVLYSSVPQLFMFIIILCVILISILMIYFAFAIIQPTRMIANKNYWAIVNPTKKTFGKL